MTAYIVSAGVTSSGITLNNGDIERVLAGGIASSTVVNSGGGEIVSSGGTTSAERSMPAGRRQFWPVATPLPRS
jgi:autotransporter passenger strand-loop-strand repeat protein